VLESQHAAIVAVLEVRVVVDGALVSNAGRVGEYILGQDFKLKGGV